MARIPVEETPLGKYPQISDTRLAQITAVLRLACGSRVRDICTHPATQALLSAIPIPDPRVEETKNRIKLEGELPSPINPPEGCRFRNRCKYACNRCRQERPELKEVEPGHWVACHLLDQANNLEI